MVLPVLVVLPVPVVLPALPAQEAPEVRCLAVRCRRRSRSR